MREGFQYVRSNRVIAALLSMLSITGVFGGAYNALLPAYAEGSLHGGAETLGWLMGAAGVGAIIGLVYLAGRDGVAGLGRVVVSCGIALGLALVALEGAPNVWIAVPVLAVIGMALILQYSAANTLIQSSVDEDKLGRVMSLYALSVFAGAPIGASSKARSRLIGRCTRSRWPASGARHPRCCSVAVCGAPGFVRVVAERARERARPARAAARSR